MAKKSSDQSLALVIGVVVIAVAYILLSNCSSGGYGAKVARRRKERFIPVAQSLSYNNADQYARPGYKSQLPPRFGSALTGTVRGPQAPAHMQGTTDGPLDLVSAVGSCGGGNGVPAELQGLSAEDVDAALKGGNDAPLQYVDPSDLLPEAQLGSNHFGNDPRNPDTYMYNRMIFANKKRRLLEDNDYIRGSLYIPQISRGYFDTSAMPHLDLRRGAMSYLGDFQSEVEKQDLFVKNTRMDALYGDQC